MREMGGTSEKGEIGAIRSLKFGVRSSGNLELRTSNPRPSRVAKRRASGGFVQARNAGTDPAEDFIGDRADPVGHFINPDRFLALLPDQRDGLTHLYRCET